MIGKLHEFGVSALDITDLSGTKLWQISMHVKSNRRILLSRALKACYLCLQLVLRRRSLPATTGLSMVPVGTRSSRVLLSVKGLLVPLLLSLLL